MGHFAKVVDGIVTHVIVADEEFFNQYTDTTPGQWIQTSYNTRGGVHLNGGVPLRKNFAAPGYTYDTIRDAFIPPKPYDSWLLDERACLWVAPAMRPQDGKRYSWDEEQTQWVEV